MDLTNQLEWWKETNEENKAKMMYQKALRISMVQMARRLRNRRNGRLYSNEDLSGLSPYNYFPTSYTDTSLPTNRIRYNVIAAIVDTIYNKFSTTRPKINYLTSGASWSKQQEAKKLTKAVYGQFTQDKVYTIGSQVIRDTLIFDIAGIHTFKEDGEVKSERVFGNNLLIDEVESAFGQLDTLMHYKYVRKSVLEEKYPECKPFLDSAANTLDPASESGVGLASSVPAEYVIVLEGWRKPSTSTSNDGVHRIALSNYVLFEEPWTQPWIPITLLKWSDKIMGMFSYSLADRLYPIQLEINKLLRDIQQSYDFLLAPKILLEAGSKVLKSALNNQIAGIINYVGTKPEIWSPPIIPAEAYQHLRYLIELAKEEAGLSSLQISGRKPGGLDSAAAMREYQDIASERFASFSMKIDEFYMEIADKYIYYLKQLGEERDYSTKYADGKFMEQVNWKDITLDKDSYIRQPYPSNLLPSQPAGKIARVGELANLGVINGQEAARLLDFPDTEAITSRKTAPLDNVDRVLDQILSKGEYTAPEPYMALDYAAQTAAEMYNYACTLEDVPEERLEMLRQWIIKANELLAVKNGAAGAQGPQAQQQQGVQPAPTVPVPQLNQ